MLSVLGNHRAAEMMAEARRLNMDAVVEVHDEVELARALALGAGIIGINNRNLRTLATDLGATEQLAPLVPADVTLVSESGIASRRDVVRLGGHADAFLVGSSLMAAPDIGEAAKALMHGRVKICGLTNAQDVAEAARHGATHAGFIMVPGTPRAVTADAATALAGNARASGMKTVAVFRDEPLDEVARLSDRLQLDAVQLHGRESAAALAELRSRLPLHTEMWAVCRVGRQAQGPRAGADRTLFDTVARGRSGGTGVAFDWSLVEGRQDLRHGFLAGGIGPDNAPAAARTGAFGLDVGSRIESVPGRKDPAKMRALFEALRPDCRRAA